MLATCRCIGARRTANRTWEHLVSDLMTFPVEGGGCDAGGCRWDPFTGCMVAFDSSMSVHVEQGTLADMLAAGILNEKVNDLGEREISVNMSAITWDCSYH